MLLLQRIPHLKTIGNHEYDTGVEYLGSFIKNLTFPVVSSNVELDDVLPLKVAGVKPYHIFPEYKLGVIGYITNTTQDISPQARGIRFYNPVGIVQHHVDELKSMGINRIVCVSHNGYEDDKYLAAK